MSSSSDYDLMTASDDPLGDAVRMLADKSPVSTRQANIQLLMGRLSPQVAEIVRLDLIQKVGNALRFALHDKKELEAIAELGSQSQEWGDW